MGGICFSAEENEVGGGYDNMANTKGEGGTGSQENLPDFERIWKDAVEEIWERHISQLPVNTDLPRLCKKITIFNQQKLIFDGHDEDLKEKPNAYVTKLFFGIATAESLNDEKTLEALKSYDTHVSDTAGDNGEQMANFFEFLVDSHGETKSLLVFKGIHQRLIFPAFYCMKDLLQPCTGKFKDQRGSWSVVILMEEDEVTIKHKKRQQAINVTQEIPDFEFTWELTLVIDTSTHTMAKEQTQIQISDIQVSDYMEKREEVLTFFEAHQTIQ